MLTYTCFVFLCICNECFSKLATHNELKESVQLSKQIEDADNKVAFIEGISQKFNNSHEATGDEYPYLYNFSEYTNYLQSLLFYKAKMACFFEKERNEEKLDMMSEVLDIKEWREITST